ncbi:MAG TPA: hypothetical protein G4O08_05180 [Anaerolineae bacterium]|nr:hypothetical protein [Anaerolineae bacterium]
MVDPSEKNTHETIIAFLDLASFDDGAAFRGACLVTDANTQPVEFRVSGAIRPTKLQRMLYGESLHRTICIDLVGLPITQTLETKPLVLVVRDAEFLKLRPHMGIPVLCIQSSGKGKFTFQAHPEFEQDAQEGLAFLPESLRANNPLEPFSRIFSGLEEAHHLNVGDT